MQFLEPMHQLCSAAAKSSRDANYRDDIGGPLTPFDFAEVGPVNASTQCQVFLRDASFATHGRDGFTERSGNDRVRGLCTERASFLQGCCSFIHDPTFSLWSYKNHG